MNVTAAQISGRIYIKRTTSRVGLVVGRKAMLAGDGAGYLHGVLTFIGNNGASDGKRAPPIRTVAARIVVVVVLNGPVTLVLMPTV
jgi:serine acetyltransferase